MAWMDISTPGEELLLVFKIVRGSSDFTSIFNVLTRLMRKALRLFFTIGLIPLGV
jgi:hypothetical protein